MARKIRTYESDDLVVEYDVKRCIHAAECVHGLPDVFDPERRPWIDPTEAAAADVVRVVERCPTGALHYRWKEGDGAETPDGPVTVRIDPNGPLFLRGDLRIQGADGETVSETRLALCRCGRSDDKPFCDGTHAEVGFEDEGALGENALKDTEGAESTVTLRPLENGPVLIDGTVTVEGADGSKCAGAGGALCRCGRSANKPFCDGTHRQVGFKAP